jgi:hypothetical protein
MHMALSRSLADVVIRDNLSNDQSIAEIIIRAKGAWWLIQPPYSFNLNPIDMAFGKRTAHLAATANTSIDDLDWRTICNIFAPFSSEDCSNSFEAAVLQCNKSRDALEFMASTDYPLGETLVETLPQDDTLVGLGGPNLHN